MTIRVYWRCFHCGETFSVGQKKWAQEHFGENCSKTPVCLIRSAGESSLLTAFRDAEKELSSYRNEDSNILRAMASMQGDHAEALRREEEKGYARGLRDGRRAIWLPIKEADKYGGNGGSYLLHAPELIDLDFNPEGVVDGHWQDDEGWIGAIWDNYQDCWAEQTIKPTHFARIVGPAA